MDCSLLFVSHSLNEGIIDCSNIDIEHVDDDDDDAGSKDLDKVNEHL